MHPPSDVVPVPPGSLRAAPGWRQRIEGATRLAIGFGAAVVETTRRASLDDAKSPLTDTVIGMTLEGQRRMLDVAERVVDASSVVTRAVVGTPPARAVVARSRSALEPFERRGRVARSRALDDARQAAPRYASRVIDGAIDVVPVDVVIAHVDIDALLSRINVQALMERVDVQRIVDRIDIDALLHRVDVNAIVARVDVDGLVERTELGAIIAKSTGGMASEALDLVRRQGVGLDGFVARWAYRLTGRSGEEEPSGPTLLVPPPVAPADPVLPLP